MFGGRLLQRVCSRLFISWARGRRWLISSSAPHLSWKITFNLGCHCLNYTQLPQGVFRSVCLPVCVLVTCEWLCSCVGVFAFACVCLFHCWFLSFSRTRPTQACFCSSIKIKKNNKGTLCCWQHRSDEQPADRMRYKGWQERLPTLTINTLKIQGLLICDTPSLADS